MEKEKLDLITSTLEGQEVRISHYKPLDKVFVGFVRDTVCGQANRDYWRCVTWRTNGTLTITYGGSTRKDLYLDLTKFNEYDKV